MKYEARRQQSRLMAFPSTVNCGLRTLRRTLSLAYQLVVCWYSAEAIRVIQSASVRRANQMWQRQFKGDLRLMLLEITVVMVAASFVADLAHTAKWRVVLFVLISTVLLAILLRITRKGAGRRVRTPPSGSPIVELGLKLTCPCASLNRHTFLSHSSPVNRSRSPSRRPRGAPPPVQLLEPCSHLQS